MARLTLQDAENVASRGRPWTIRLESPGQNLYWYATGRSLTEAVETGCGATGSPPTLQLSDWTALRADVTDKLSAGYIWANTPFIRMSAASLTAVAVPVPAQPVATPVVPPQPVATPTAQQVPSVQANKGAVHALKVVRDGIKVVGYKGLDSAGNVLCDFDAPTGLAFAQQHNLDVLFV